MEVFDLIKEMINSLGFPIAMVAYFIYDKSKVTNKLVEMVNNNTLVLTRLLEKLDSGDLFENE